MDFAYVYLSMKQLACEGLSSIHRRCIVGKDCLPSVAVTRHSDQNQLRAGNELFGLHFQVTSIIRRSWAGTEVGTQRRNCRGMFLTVSFTGSYSASFLIIARSFFPGNGTINNGVSTPAVPMDTSSGVPQLELKSSDS